MNKKVFNKKGFTLVEVIISLAVLMVIVSITYMILNSSNKLLNTQKSTSNIQQGINLTTRYLTKDLEKSISFTETNPKKSENSYITMDNNVYTYEFSIKGYDNTVTYSVKINKKGDKYFYSLDRVNGSSVINIIPNQAIKSNKINGITNIEIPFEIKNEIENNNSLYNVYIRYIDKNQGKSYGFKVYKRTDRIETFE